MTELSFLHLLNSSMSSLLGAFDLDVRKSYERQASKKFYYKCPENSRSQIVFRTDIFRKLTLGAPGYGQLKAPSVY